MELKDLQTWLGLIAAFVNAGAACFVVWYTRKFYSKLVENDSVRLKNEGLAAEADERRKARAESFDKFTRNSSFKDHPEIALQLLELYPGKQLDILDGFESALAVRGLIRDEPLITFLSILEDRAPGKFPKSGEYRSRSKLPNQPIQPPE